MFFYLLFSIKFPDFNIPAGIAVDSHSKYEEAPQVFEFIRNRLLGILPLPETTKSVKLLADNTVQLTPDD